MKDRRYFGLTLCMSGQITYRMNGKSFVSTKDTVLLLPQGGTYDIAGDKDGFFPVINFLADGLDVHELKVIPLENPQVCVSLFETLQKAFVSGKSPFYIFSVFYQLLDEIVTQSTDRPNVLIPALKYIEQNLSSPVLSNQGLADFLGISESYLRKLFIQHLDTTPKQYILNLRIQKARQLLSDTVQPVTAISEVCGFTSVYHFSREFKQKTGLSPTQYAQRNRVFNI